MAAARANNADVIARLQALEQQQQPAAAAPAAPSTGLKLEPYGASKDEDVRRWLDRFALYRDANGLNDARARATLAFSLSGPAENWLNAQPADTVDTVERLTAALRAAFSPIDESAVLRERVMSRRQGQRESVEAHAAVVLDLCRRLDVNMPARDRCGYIIYGLHAAIKEHLLSTLPNADNVENLLRAARNKEQALQAVMPATVNAATFQERNPLQELAQDIRRVLNKMDSLSDRVAQIESHQRQERAGDRTPGRFNDNAARARDNYNDRGPQRPQYDTTSQPRNNNSSYNDRRPTQDRPRRGSDQQFANNPRDGVVGDRGRRPLN